MGCKPRCDDLIASQKEEDKEFFWVSQISSKGWAHYSIKLNCSALQTDVANESDRLIKVSSIS